MNALLTILTFPEGLIWPQLQHNWYAALTVAWFPFGLFLFIRAWREA